MAPVNTRKPLEMSTIAIAVLVILILVQVAAAEKPNTPTLYTPSDSSEVTTLTPTFEWSPFSDPDGDHQSFFNIVVWEEPGPDTKGIFPPVLDYYGSSPNSSATPNEKDYAKGLENGKWYHWHVRVMDNNNNWSVYANDTEYSYMDFKVKSGGIVTNYKPNMPTFDFYVEPNTGLIINRMEFSVNPLISGFNNGPEQIQLTYIYNGQTENQTFYRNNSYGGKIKLDLNKIGDYPFEYLTSTIIFASLNQTPASKSSSNSSKSSLSMELWGQPRKLLMEKDIDKIIITLDRANKTQSERLYFMGLSIIILYVLSFIYVYLYKENKDLDIFTAHIPYPF